MHQTDPATERFIRGENLKRLRALLARTNNEVECQRILNLIEEEAAKTTET